MRHTILGMVMMMTLFVACGGGDASDADRAIVDLLTERLQLQSTTHYAFGCVDFEGTVLASEILAEAIASDAGIEPEHAASAWVFSDERGIILGGGDGDQQSIVIYDPDSQATNAEEFEEREVDIGGGTLTCFVPK